MADEELVARLKRGIQEWNTWRQGQLDLHPNLRDVDLSGVDFSGADLKDAYFSHTNLSNANLSGANLFRANFFHTNLSHADLGYAFLDSADFSSANLTEADLSSTNLSDAQLNATDFTSVQFWDTLFVRVDLSNIKGLGTANHIGPSTVNINSVILPYDEATRIHFLRGVGFTEGQIEYLPSLLTPRSIQYYSLFISYAHQDEIIAKRLYADLRKKDVPCWFAPHDLRPGTPIMRGIEEAIHLHDKLLLILSKNAVMSNWVQQEVETALYKGTTTGQEILFPIRLDDTILEIDTLWAKRLRQRHISDFTGWQEEQRYQEAFVLLLRHLKTESSPSHNTP